MNSIFRQAVAVCVLALFTIAVSGASPEQAVLSTPLPDSVAGALVGASAWGQFLAGVGCGAGLVAMASGFASGIGSVGALLLTVTTLRACDSAFS